MSIWLAEINGKLVRSIIGKDFKKFLLKVSFIPNLIIILTNYCSIDIQSDAVFNPIISSKFWSRLLQQAACSLIQRKNHLKVPRGIFAENVLLQDLQLGLQNIEPGLKTNSRCRKMGLIAFKFILKHNQTCSGYCFVFIEACRASRLVRTRCSYPLVLPLRYTYKILLSIIWSIDSNRTKN